jgi:hypothetical protein
MVWVTKMLVAHGSSSIQQIWKIVLQEISLSSTNESIRPMKEAPKTPSPLLMGSCCWYLNRIAQYGNTLLQMCLPWKFCMAFLVKAPEPVKSTQLLKNGSSPHCRRIHWQMSWRRRKWSGPRTCTLCRCYGYNCSWRTRHSVMRAICTDVRTGIFLCTSQNALFLISSPYISPSLAAKRRRANSIHLPDATTNVVKHTWILKSSLKTPLHIQLLHQYYGLRQEFSTYQNVLFSTLSTELQNKEDIQKTSLDCTCASLEINAWCHLLVDTVNWLPLQTQKLNRLLLNLESGSDKRQVVIHFFLSKYQYP